MIHSGEPVRRKLAWEFIKLATGPVGQTITARRTGYVPVNELALRTPDLLGDWYMIHKDLSVPVRQLPRVGAW
jgi:multiple sugar transport system substrate-binding protein